MKVCLNLCLLQTVHITILRIIYIEALIIRIRDNFLKSSNSLDRYYKLFFMWTKQIIFKNEINFIQSCE